MLNCAWFRVLPSPASDAATGQFEIGRIALDIPKVVMRDLSSPGISGVQCPSESLSSIVMLVLTVHTDDPRAIEAECAVACEHVLQNRPGARGGMRGPLSEIHPPEPAPDRLTPHETRLLTLLAEGHSYKTAAAVLGVSRHTVSFHLRSIYAKLQVHSKSEAVSKALRNRLL